MKFAALIAALALSAAAPIAAPAAQCYSNGVPCGAGAGQIAQAEVSLDTQGLWTWDFNPAFPAPPAIVHIPTAASATDAVICNKITVTATRATGRCWRTNVVGGLLSGLLSGSTSGLTVTLVARYIPS